MKTFADIAAKYAPRPRWRTRPSIVNGARVTYSPDGKHVEIRSDTPFGKGQQNGVEWRKR